MMSSNLDPGTSPRMTGEFDMCDGHLVLVI
jgi:hypothetical protein